MTNKNQCIIKDTDKIRVKRGWKLRPSDMETPTGVSMTIRDESYTVRELLIKHTRGIDLGVERNVFYNEDSDHDDEDFSRIQRMDLHDKEVLLMETKERVKRYKAKPEPVPEPPQPPEPKAE